jgi:glycosyltransferase involved in cell wall biosynthesis
MLSVLMPVFNAEKYLSVAVQSILDQTYRDFDFLIINDGSTDSSLGILEDFASIDKRIRLVSRPNKGLVNTLNEGLQLIKTPYIARMDADDIAFPHRFERQMDYLHQNPDCLLLGSRVIIIDPEGEDICEMGKFFSHKDLDDGLMSKKGQLIYHPSVIFQREPVIRIGGYRNNYPHVEDLDLFLRLSETGKIENLPETLLKYREHTDKIGYVYIDQQTQQIEQLIKEAHERRGLSYTQGLPPTKSNMTVSDRWRIWSWWALKAGNLSTARKYAFKALSSNFFSLESWRLVFCALRGH